VAAAVSPPEPTAAELEKMAAARAEAALDDPKSKKKKKETVSDKKAVVAGGTDEEHQREWKEVNLDPETGKVRSILRIREMMMMLFFRSCRGSSS
jgi:hypothetical protein